MISEANNLILIVSPLEKAVPGAIIKAFPCADRLTSHLSTLSDFFISLKWYITEKHSDVFPLQQSIIVEVVPG